MKSIHDWMKEEGPTTFEGASLLSAYMAGVQFGHHLFDAHGVTTEQAATELPAAGETIPSNLASVESAMAGAILRVGVTVQFMYWLGVNHALLMNSFPDFIAREKEASERAAGLMAALKELLPTAEEQDTFGLPQLNTQPVGGLN